MARLVFENSGDAYELPDGSKIMESCDQEGIPFGCTEGMCGTCIVEVIEGMENLSPFNRAEQDYFGDEGKQRLSCQCSILRGCVKLKF